MTLNPKIKIAFASGTDPLNRRLIEHLRALYPDLPLWVVSNFPPEDPALKWIRYRVNRSFAENLRRCREELRGYEIRLAGVMLVPNVPFRRMRLLALVLSPRAFVAFNENLNHFMLRPASAPRHRPPHRVARRQHPPLEPPQPRAMPIGPNSPATPPRLLPQPWGSQSWLPPAFQPASGHAEPRSRLPAPPSLSPGVTVVIPSRTGKDLLQAQLPGTSRASPQPDRRRR